MKELRHLQNVTKDGVATILLYDGIGTYVNANGEACEGIDGNEFAKEIDYLNEQPNCTQINVRINSFGGSVIQGYSIVSAIQNSKLPVHTFCDGLCASIAGVILLAGDKVHMKDYGTIMLHNPSGSDDEELLNRVKDTLVVILANNTHFTPEMVSEVMDKETYYSAKEAVQAGLVDAIIPSKKKPKVDTSSLYAMAMCYNSLIQKPNTKMIKVKNQLGLDENVNEEAVVKTIDQLQKEIETLKAEKLAVETSKEELNAKLEQIEKEKEEAHLLEVTEMVNSFITDEEERKKHIKLALVDFDTVKNTLTKIKSTEAVKIMNKVKPFVGAAPDANDRSTWTILDYEKKDPTALAKIKNETPELYNNLFDAFYKK